MPNWFRKQMADAFLTKDICQIKMLNQCWFFYVGRRISK
ncbi:cortex morphogenetic protein CmpA [Paraliobacillus sp. JSM ZJ581]